MSAGSAGRGERHRVGKQCGSVDAHRSAALEIAADDQRNPGDPLHAVHKRGQRIRLGAPDTPRTGVVHQNQTADAFVANQVEEGPVLLRSRIRRLAVKRNYDKLGDFLAQGQTNSANAGPPVLPAAGVGRFPPAAGSPSIRRRQCDDQGDR